MQNVRFYPAEIERVELAVLALDEKLRQANRLLRAERARLDDLVAAKARSDDEDRPTNKDGREALLGLLMTTDPAYLEADDRLFMLANERAALLASLAKTRNEFAVAKLELRREIVREVRVRRMDEDEIDDLVSASPLFDRQEF